MDEVKSALRKRFVYISSIDTCKLKAFTLDGDL